MTGKLFPVFLNLKKKACLVVGSGESALSHAASLLEAGAEVTVVSQKPCQELLNLQKQGKIYWSDKAFSEQDLSGCYLAIAATDDCWVNEWVFQACENRRIPVHVVDQPEYSSFQIPAVAGSGPVQVAVSTSGASAVLDQMLRDKVDQELLGPEVGLLAAFMGAWRSKIRQHYQSPEARQTFWREVIRTDVSDLARNGYWEEANGAMEALLSEVALSA